MKTTLGGDRLGSGGKQVYSDKTYERSTHDLGYVFRTSAAAGTLIPFMSEVGLPGDSWDIDLQCEVMTLPTVGPLFGTYKVQLDIFEVPVRLYQAKLHMNALNIGMNMSQIKLPQMQLKAVYTSAHQDETQVHPSSIFSYLNIRGLGQNFAGQTGDIQREFNALPYLAYYDIFKNYYANKQETNAYVINNPMTQATSGTITQADLMNNTGNTFLGNIAAAAVTGIASTTELRCVITVILPAEFANSKPEFDYNAPLFSTNLGARSPNELFKVIQATYSGSVGGGSSVTYATIVMSGYTPTTRPGTFNVISPLQFKISSVSLLNNRPQLTAFPLANIDTMRANILAAVGQQGAFTLTSAVTTPSPYNLSMVKGTGGYSMTSSQQGLVVKTYQSDLLNNWISTEWITGTNGVNEVTSVSTTGNKFTIDALNLASKVYTMLNRIAISGGTYDDWLDAVYTHERARSVENPVYHGSLIRELAFEEVINTSAAEDQPLGTLAGRGRMTGSTKGGSIRIKCNEPCYIMGIVSLTPRIDYSQGNQWDTNLKTMNDFHKPALDAIGYQDLITDQMAYFDTTVQEVAPGNFVTQFKSAGKQPAWVNYMTNINRCRGNFAMQNREMFMTLNRRYEQAFTGGGAPNGIKDVTTYIDPSKFNNIFAETQLDSQNFWIQIGNNVVCRRKMSAKVIPNL